MKNKNFARTISILSILLLTVVLVNFFGLIVSISEVKNNKKSLLETEFTQSVAEVNTSLDNIHNMMMSELSSDVELDRLLEEEDDRNLTIDEYATIRRLNTLMANWSKNLGYQVSYAIYYPSNGITMHSSSTREDHVRWNGIKFDLFKKINSLDYQYNWQMMKLNQDNYLVNIITRDTITMICYIDIHAITQYLENNIYGDQYYIASYQKDLVFTENAMLKEDQLEPKKLDNVYSKGQLMAVKDNLQNELNLLLVVHHYNKNTQIMFIQFVLWILLVFMIISMVVFVAIINKKIVMPIQRFNKNVENMKNNETVNLETHYQIKELENASELMNVLVGRIKKLKIDIYEKTVEQQKTKMDFLSLQIEPHFYLNCLNNIYSMAQMRQYNEIQKLSSSVSIYLRYIFKSSDELVSVSDEIKHIEQYLKIQQMRYPDGFTYHIQVADQVKRASIPPLILQTFVENTIKYNVNGEDEVNITIKGILGEKVQIVIEDNGSGFEQDILDKLNTQQDIRVKESRIGIMNAVERMQMVFKNESKIIFSNKQKGGAVVTISMPFMDKTNSDFNENVFDSSQP